MERNNPFKSNGHGHSRINLRRIQIIGLILLLLLLSISLAGCVSMTDSETSQDYTSDPIVTLDADTSLGQSFISRRPDLMSITVWLTRVGNAASISQSAEANFLIAQLYLSPGAVHPVFATTVAIPATASKLPITITFPKQNYPAGQAYFLRLSNASGTIQVDGRNGDAYPDGQAYINDQPINADIAFRGAYDYGFSTFMSDIVGLLPSAWLVIPLLIVLWLPGWLLLEFSGLSSLYDLGERVALAGGLSLAVIPVSMLWTTTLKIKWTSTGLWFTSGFLIAILAVRLIFQAIKHRKNSATLRASHQSDTPSRLSWMLSSEGIQFLALILIFLAAFAVRLVMVRDLATPAWVDSVHHALLTRLIMDNGSYPATYLPYFDFSPTMYHPGFHSIAAAFTWLSRLDLARSLLVLGQVLNAFTVFSVYLFTKALTRSATAGLFASAITGFITPMPAYYTSWGRYTELTGLLLLPEIIALIRPWLEGIDHKKTGWVILLGGLSAGGLFMIHYRVLAFMACLVLAYFLIQLYRQPSSSSRHPIQLLVLLLAMAVFAIILVLPWFIPTLSSTLLPSITANIPSSIPFFQGFSWPYLTSAFGKQAMALGGLGLLWGILKRERFTFMIILWVVFLFFMANLGAFRLPGSSLISTPTVEIMLFLPISILGGYFVSQLINLWRQVIPSRLAAPAYGILLLSTAFLSYLGARQLAPILNPVTILSRQADLAAIAWLNENIPQGETVVINPFAWGYGLYAGNDGGYWISPLVGRRTLPPPVLYALDQDSARITTLAQQVMAAGSDPVALRDLLKAHQLTYIYIGARGGVISPDKLISSNLFNLLYHQNGVWILAVKP